MAQEGVMSSSDGLTLLESHLPSEALTTDHAIIAPEPSDLTSLVASSEIQTASSYDAVAQSEPADVWTDEPPSRRSSRSQGDKQRKRRKHSSKSNIRTAFQPSNSSIWSTKSRYKKGSRDYKKERDHGNSGHKRRDSAKSLSLGSLKEQQSPLYRRPRADQSSRIARQSSGNLPLNNRVRPLVSPSLLSVLSALTGRTESSSGSNTTVTQRSYDGASSSGSTARPTHHRCYSSEKLRTLRPRDRPRLSRGPSKEAIDVFKFLEKDPRVSDIRISVATVPEPTGSVDQRSEPAYAHSPAESVVTKSVSFADGQVKEDSTNPDLFHSDSGVSVGGESPEFTRRTNLRYRPPSVESVPEDQWLQGAPPKNQGTQAVDAHFYHEDPNGREVTSAYQEPQLIAQRAYGPSPQPPSYSLHRGSGWNHMSPDPAGPTVTIAGYELLASKLSAMQNSSHHGSERLVPLYRRFEPLHHRVLLHLQDEICELEEELRRLDECIAQVQPSMDGFLRPASRREDVRFGDSLRYQRTDLLGRICMKLTTYSQALKSYTSITRGVESAADEDIDTYKDWLHRYEPIAKTESDFLEHHEDLFRISSHPLSSTFISEHDIGESQPSPNDGTTERGKARSVYVTPEDDNTPDRYATPTPGESPSQAHHDTLVEPAVSQLRALEPGTSLRWLLAGPPAALLLTFCAFLVIPTLFGRLVVLSILAGMGYIILVLAEVDEHITGKEMTCCIATYVGVMAAIAGALQ